MNQHLNHDIDLKKEQQVSLERQRYKYSLAAKFFFLAMDIVAGRKNTLPKAKLLEILASIPYREWEIRQYKRITRFFGQLEKVKWAETVIEWGRHAQDNEYDHLLVIHEKMKEDNIKSKWYLWGPMVFLFVLSYTIISRFMALVNIKRAFLFNAEFEDHAEHVYAQVVAENPQWEEQPVANELVKNYYPAQNWADIFRRIGLDERDHMNSSFVFCGKKEKVVSYEGMPNLPQDL